MRPNFKRFAGLALAMILLPTLVYGSQAVVPNQFVNGDVADADQVNANFGALAAAINDNDARIESNAAAVEPLACTAIIRVPVVVADEAASGQALRDAVEAIPTDPAVNAYVLRLQPGVYDIGGERLILPSNITLRGAGRERTTIHGTGDSVALVGNGSSVVIRDLAMRLRPTNNGTVLSGSNSGQAVLRHVRLDVLAPGVAVGLRVAAATFDLHDADIVVESTSTTVNAAGVSVGTSGGNPQDGTLTALACRISVVGGQTNSGLIHNHGLVTLQRCDVSAPGGSGITNLSVTDATDVVELHGCRVEATSALHVKGVGSIIRAACSRIDGNLLGGPVTVHCYDEDFAAIP